MHKKGQAALEFLTTYGWAFLVILVMIGALAYFGVLNPQRFVPDTCTFGSSFICDDHVVNTASVTVKLRNNIEAITITNVTITDLDTGLEYGPALLAEWSSLFSVGGCNIPAAGTVGNASCSAGSVMTLVFNTAGIDGTFPTFTEGVKKKLSIDINFFETASGPTFGRNSGGDVVGTVQP